MVVESFDPEVPQEDIKKALVIGDILDVCLLWFEVVQVFVVLSPLVEYWIAFCEVTTAVFNDCMRSCADLS